MQHSIYYCTAQPATICHGVQPAACSRVVLPVAMQCSQLTVAMWRGWAAQGAACGAPSSPQGKQSSTLTTRQVPMRSSKRRTWLGLGLGLRSGLGVGVALGYG